MCIAVEDPIVISYVERRLFDEGVPLVFTVRCFKCGDSAVRLVLGGRAILHARCHSCDANLLAEVLEFEQQVLRGELGETTEAEEEEFKDPPTGEIDTSILPDELVESA